MQPEFSPGRIVQIKTPETILFGIGASRELPERIEQFPDGRVLIVTDSGLVKAGIAATIRDLLTSAKRSVEIFDGVQPDPDKECVDNCLTAAKSSQAKVLLGIGGGSSMDVAKVTAALAVNGGQISDYVGVGKLPRRGLPTILMPTTAGTGSEVTPIAVISDLEQHLKLGLVSPHLYCNLAIVDPELTLSCPPKTTASAGLDTLTHAVEVLTNKFASPIIDTLMFEAIRLIGLHLRTCFRNGSDLQARAGMSLAALYGGLGLGPVNTAAVHALAYPLGGTFDIPHGLANSILLPYVMEFNRPACLEKYARIAQVLEPDFTGSPDEKATRAVRMVVDLAKDVGIPQRLREIDIPHDAIEQMAVSAAKVTRLLNNNPRQMTVEDIKALYERAY